MTFFGSSSGVLAAGALLALVASSTLHAESAAEQAARLDRIEADVAAAQATIELAQGYGVPPSDIGGSRDYPYGAAPPDSGGVTVRIDRLENHMRQINGQIEQLQFETRKLAEQLRKFQEDVDFRFQDSGARGASPAAAPRPAQKRTEAPEADVDPDSDLRNFADAATVPNSSPSNSAAARSSRRGDAFDPDADPNAPGAPHPLGSPASSSASYEGRTAGLTGGASTQARRDPTALDQDDPDAPLDLSGGKLRGGGISPSASPPPSTRQFGEPTPPQQAYATPSVTPGGTTIAGAPVNSAKEEFELALGFFRKKEYESAEKGFTDFLKKNSKSKLASDATYYLGESYFARGRHTEAAEQYLKISTQYANSPRAPEAMLRLGQSLNAIGAKEQACATLVEIGRRFPNASASVKAGAERETRRSQC
ncbi:tol-pal system protein YbgF [Methylocapsa acidiphila]|uniref:tol-pal system protein YbgF n=1 Tax=Methylocapsa acidiphila TaxID=133552 RepID=UPI0018DE69FC|nr:tol-pal system protein YbgF [Methylocapsa acidiphila]